MLVTAITLTTALLAAILSAFLLSKHLHSRANSWLSALFACFALLGMLAAGYSVGWTAFPLFATLNDIMWELLLPSLLLGYIVQILQETRVTSRTLGLTFLPFIFTTAINLYVDVGSELEWYNLPIVVSNRIAFYYEIEGILTIIYTKTLIYWAYRLVMLNRTHYSFTWCRRLVKWFGITALIWLCTYVASIWIETELMGAMWACCLLLICIVVYDGVLGLRLLEHRASIKSLLDSYKTPTTQKVSAPKTPLPVTTAFEPITFTAVIKSVNPYLAHLDSLLSKEAIYRNPNLSRDDLAAELGISGGHLGRLLAEAGKPTFSKLIAEYRIEEVKRLLADPAFEHFSIHAIGLESGFRSKSAFNEAFKRITGTTPAAFRQSLD